MKITWIVLGVAALVALFLISMYNSLVGLRNQVKNAWSQIDVQLKRRYDLIPNLIETVKGYVKHESETLTTITKARATAMSAGSVGDKARAEGALTDAVNKFLVVAESYPDLKANQNFLALQEELRSTENKIAFSRQSYNDQVMFYNNKLEMFPSSLIAGAFGFKAEESFKVESEAERQAPKVQF
jgi:LemA protein